MSRPRTLRIVRNNPLDGLTHAEQIVWFFQYRVTEAHRTAIEIPTGLTPEQFDAAIPKARDLGVELGFNLCAIHDEGREGWWTCRPTVRLAVAYIREAAKRNLGEAERNLRVFDSMPSVRKAISAYHSGIQGGDALLSQALSEVDVTEDFDYVLGDVDKAIGAGLGFVKRTEPLAVAA